MWKVGIHPTVAHIEIGGLLRATDDEDGGGLCAIGYGVADVAQGNPTLREIMRVRHLALVRCPTRTGGVEHEVEVGIAFLLGRNTHNGWCLAAVALEEWRVGDGCEVVVAQAEQSKVGVLLGGGDEIGCAIVVDKHITVTTLDAHRPSRPHELIIAIDGIALEAGGLRSSVVARLPVAPHHIFASFLVVEQLGTLNHAPASQVGRGHSVLNDLLHECPVLQVLR